MLTRSSLLRKTAAVLAAVAAGAGPRVAAATDAAWKLSESQWRQRLKPQVFAVLRLHNTEPPFSSPLDHEKRAGTFSCAGCALALFSSKTKFDSGTGWPSFYRPLPAAVDTSSDYELLEPRTEVHCHRCGGHLGHVFNDGPQPTGLRYCMNGLALTFNPEH